MHRGFHQSFQDAIVNATGQSWSAIEGQPSIQDFLDQKIAQSRSQIDHIDHYYQMAYDSDTQLIVHPYAETFTQEDFEDIAHVQLVGRLAMDHTIVAMAKNPAINDLVSPEILTRESEFEIELYSRMGDLSERWRRLPQNIRRFERINTAQAPDELPHVIAPQTYEQWPDSEQYINCLGTATGMAALADGHERPFAFANELVTADTVTGERHRAFRDALEQLSPGFFEDPTIGFCMEQLDELYPPEHDSEPHTFAELLQRTPSSLSEQTTVRDFHHYIVERGFLPHHYTQIDPYALTIGMLSNVHRYEQDERFEVPPFAVLHNTAYGNQLYAFTMLQVGLDAYRRTVAAFPTTSHERYSTETVAGLIQNVATVTGSMGDALGSELAKTASPSRDLDEKTAQEHYRHKLHTRAFMLRVIAEASVLQQYSGSDIAAQRLADADIRHMETSNDETFAASHALILANRADLIEEMKYNAAAKEAYLRLMRAVPLMAISQEYILAQREHLQSLTTGSPNVASELCDPEFMIGAMHMNHLSTWRKDGRINVSQHLARLSPSQLLWYGAHQDGENKDERIVAVGEQIQQLRSYQRHPLVDLALRAFRMSQR